jgi:methylenetetrahydrofolate reductase (NADH)
MTLPVVIGMPGKVARHRLLEMSMRIGVGPSLTFLRKQRGIRNLLGKSAPDRRYDALARTRDARHLNITGFHYFTFNQLVDTWQWKQQKHDARLNRATFKDSSAVTRYVHPEESTT